MSQAHAQDEPVEVLSCLLEPSMLVEISAQQPGIVEAVMVERGDSIGKGDTIVKLRAGVERAAAKLADARHRFAKRKLARNQDLIEKDLLSEHERDEMETETKIAGHELEEARARLAMRTIRSPIDGIVISREAQPGEYVGEEPVMKLAALDPLRVEVIAPVSELGRIRVGSRATIETEVIEGRHEAVVKVVDAVIDPTSDTFGMRLELANPGLALPAGLKCRVSFASGG